MDQRFIGNIAGLGTTSGVRLVLGLWRESPFGAFADVMVQEADGRRILLAPTDEIASFVSTTYSFDEIRVAPVSWLRLPDGLSLTASALDVKLTVGGSSPMGRMLRLVPRALATRPAFLTVIDPIARVVAPGTRTAGSAGSGRREYYGVTRARRIIAASGSWQGSDLGSLAPLSPPVTFGFASAPAAPHLVDVTTTIRS